LQPPAKRGISRRTAIVGLVSVVGLATVGGGIVLFQSRPDLHLLYTYRGHTDHVDAVAWSSNGRRIASGSDDKTAQVWDATNGAYVYTYRGHSDAVSTVAWSPDGKRIASGSWDKTVRVWTTP
jgi:WD40 repeat protein